MIRKTSTNEELLIEINKRIKSKEDDKKQYEDLTKDIDTELAILYKAKKNCEIDIKADVPLEKELIINPEYKPFTFDRTIED